MEKIQRTTVIEGGIDDLLLKVHEEYLRTFHKKINESFEFNLIKTLDCLKEKILF